MTSMTFCTSCGAELPAGTSFCVSCGAPVPEPRAADAQHGSRIRTPAPPVAPWDEPRPASASDVHSGRRTAAAAALAAVLLGVAGGAYLLSRRGPDTSTGRGPGPAVQVPPSASPRPTTPSPPPAVGTAPAAGPSHDLTAQSRATAQSQAPDNVDDAGNRVSYDAAQMVDGLPGTCWRTRGDATGQVLQFQLAASRKITQVGLVNGYAKTDQATGRDRYAQERRLTTVTWLFDDGTTLRQDLSDATRSVQSVVVPGGVRSRTVRMRIDGTTVAGDPQFDFTAVSDVAIMGS